MSYPVGWDLVNITGTYVGRNGVPCVGSVTLSSPQLVLRSGTIVPAADIVFDLVNGAFSGQIPATDDPNASPTGWVYTVTENVPGGRQGYQIVAPHTSPGIDLSTVVPVMMPQPPTYGFPYVTPAQLAGTAVGDGAYLIGYQNPQSGSIARTVQSKLQEIVSIEDFGGVGDGLTDATSALQAALNAANAAGGGTVYVPSGKWLIGAITLPVNTAIAGAGKFVTTFVPKTASITLFTATSTGLAVNQTFSDFNINCGSTANVNGFKFTQCFHVGLYRIAFYGCLSNFEFDQGYWYDVEDCDSIGTPSLKAGSCKIWSSSDTQYIFQVGLRRYSINNIGNGVQGPLVYIRRGVDVQLHQVNCNDANVGGAVTFFLVENDCQGCKISQCAAGASYTGLLVQQGTGVAVAPSFLDIISCDFDQSEVGAINLNNANQVLIEGGNFTSSGVATTASAVTVLSGCADIRIRGVMIYGYNGTNGAGITISGATKVLLEGNYISNCYFALVMAASPTNIRAIGNVMENFTSAYNGSLVGSGNWFESNPGLNPVNIATPAMPASDTAVTNTTGAIARVSVTGGTTTAVTILGGSAWPTGGQNFNFELVPGEQVAITYSVAPSWVWRGK